MSARPAKSAAGTGLARLFDPRSIAVIGASDDLAKVGGRVVHLLTTGGYRGSVFPVNPRRDTIALAGTRLTFALKEQERQADLVARQFVSAARFDEARQGAEIGARQIAAREASFKAAGLPMRQRAARPWSAPGHLRGYGMSPSCSPT